MNINSWNCKDKTIDETDYNLHPAVGGMHLYGCGSPAERQADGAGERDGTAGHSR
ncbi:MAG: hypothetical protein SOX26_05650 [Phocaeicola sp.]|nr:hypothetical protein [Phocaeicola sp.]